MDRIVNQMLHIAQYLEWDPTELKPVSFWKHGVTSKRKAGHPQDKNGQDFPDSFCYMQLLGGLTS